MMKVNLRTTVGYGRPPIYYGPGLVEVPEGLARALGLKAIEGADEQTEGPPAEGELIGGFLPVPGAQPLPTPPDRLALDTRLGIDTASHLALAGFPSVEAVRAASDEELLDIKGIGPATLRTIRAALQE